MKQIVLSLLIALFFITGCQATTKTNEEEVKINLFVTQSLESTLEQITTDYKKEHTNIDITLTAAPSSNLIKEILDGESCDLVIVSNQTDINTLIQRNLIAESNVEDFVQNKLVLIAKDGSTINSVEDLFSGSIDRIAIGEASTVPLGQYTQEALTNLEMWDQLQNKLIYGKDTSQVMEYVEDGSADCGVVFESDAVLNKNVKVVADFPEKSYTPILYPMVVLNNAPQRPVAMAFEEYLLESQAQSIANSHGFSSVKVEKEEEE